MSTEYPAISFRVTPELDEQIRREAKRCEQSVSEWVRDTIEFALEEGVPERIKDASVQWRALLDDNEQFAQIAQSFVDVLKSVEHLCDTESCEPCHTMRDGIALLRGETKP